MAGMRPALQQMGMGGISKRCARGWLPGIRFNTWNAAFRNGVTVGNRGGCAMRSVARGRSSGASRYSSLYGRHSGLLGVPITTYWCGCRRFSLSSLMQRGGVKSGAGGLFSWFSSPGIKGNGSGDGGAGGGGSNGMGDGAVAGKTGSGDGGSGSALTMGHPTIRGEFPSASTGGQPGATRW